MHAEGLKRGAWAGRRGLPLRAITTVLLPLVFVAFAASAFAAGAGATDENAPARNSLGVSLEANGSISGHVYGRDGSALEGVTVIAGSWRVDTRADGSYAIQLPAGSYEVRFDPMTYNYTHYPDYDDSIYPSAVVVSSGVDSGGIDATLEAFGSVAGHVYARDGQPLQWVRVWVNGMFAYTDAEGAYAAGQLGTGTYTVTFDADYVNSLRLPSDPDFVNRYTEGVTVLKGVETSGIDATLDTCTIRGHVYGPDGGALSGIWVTAWNSTLTTGGYTDPSGEFILPRLAQGYYSLAFDASEYNESNSPSVVSAPYAMRPYVGAYGGTATCDMTLKAGAVIGGHVYGPWGEPLEGILVMVSGPSDGAAYTDASGEYHVVGLPGGSDYMIAFDTADFNDVNDSDLVGEDYPFPVAVGPGGETTGIDAYLQVAGSVSGRVTRADNGAPLEGVLVSADGSCYGESYTDADGRYTITGLGEGAYLVSFDPAEYNAIDGPNFLPVDYPTDVSVVAGEDAANVNASLAVDGQPVYRFYNFTNGTHFFTYSRDERDMAIARWPNVFRYEGIAYYLDPAMNRFPLFRFYNRVSGSHFYTNSVDERNRVEVTWPKIFTYEGRAYAVSISQVPDSVAVHRFYNLRNGSHFYTASESERDIVTRTWPDVYRYEGVAFWVAQ